MTPPAWHEYAAKALEREQRREPAGSDELARYLAITDPWEKAAYEDAYLRAVEDNIRRGRR